MSKSKKNKLFIDKDLSLARLDALLVLLSELLCQLSKDKASAKGAREKSAVILVSGGMTQERAAKVLGMQKKTVVEAIKNIKI
ncbi:MAG: hypothetical protein PHT44_01885 [Candidatus Portnoybacteria bacterium]|nr:hypothetical protein [Candidatus Portnoybacteria bacterium]MDD4982656.1 hypothetical protein [Candidatus Portnoybacteria bacterium]